MTSLKQRDYYKLITNGCSFVWGDELQGCDTDPPSHQGYRFTTHLANQMSKSLGRNVDHNCLATCGGGNRKIFRDTINYLTAPDSRHPTHMVVNWSALQRDEYFEIVGPSEQHGLIHPKQNMTQYSPERVTAQFPPGNLRDSINNWYSKHYRIQSDVIQLFTYMLALRQIADACDITLIQGVFHSRVYSGILGSLKYQKSPNGSGDNSEWINFVREKQIKRLSWYDRLGLPFSKKDVYIPHQNTNMRYEWTDMYSLVCQKYKQKPYGHPDERTHKEFANTLYHAFLLMESGKFPIVEDAPVRPMIKEWVPKINK